MAVTTQEQIDIGRVCGVLAANKLQGGKTHGGALDTRIPSLLHMVTDTLEDLYTLSPSDEDIAPIQNYLNSICKDVPRAAYLLSIDAGGGSISPVVPAGNTVPQPYDFEVSVISFPLADGGSSVILDGTNGTQDFRGYNLDVLRNGIGQNTSVNPGSYFSWNRVTGEWIMYPAVSTGEFIRATPSN